jgi:hypothetical protein
MAQSLKDIQYAQQGELIKDERQQEEAHIAMSEAPIANAGNVYKVYKLSDTRKTGNYHMDGIDDVWNPETKRIERIRLLRGFPSIWLKDQKDLDKAFIESNRRSLTFTARVLRLPDYDTTAIEFLLLSNANIDNPNKKGTRRLTFFEWNPQRQAEVERKKRLAKVEAIKFATTASVDDMRKHANYLGISFIDDLGFPKSDDALRNDYELYAEAQPNKFMASAGSKEVEIAFIVKKAILDSKIDLTAKLGSAYWADNGGFICKIPTGVEPQEYLVEYAMLPQDEGKAFLSQLKKLK